MVDVKKNGAILFSDDLRDGAKWCRIGILKDGILVIWTNVKNIFQKYNSVGFAKELLAKVPFEKLRFCISDGRIFETTREFFVSHCFPVREPGWEEQVHLRLSDFGMDKVEEWEESQKRLKDISLIRQMIEEQEREKRNGQMGDS